MNDGYLGASEIERETGLTRQRLTRLAMLGHVKTRIPPAGPPLYSLSDVKAYLSNGGTARGKDRQRAARPVQEQTR